MRQENPIEKYGMARYDAANRKPRGQEGTFQRRDGNQARDEARRAAAETTAPTFSELQSQGRARPAPPMMANMAMAFQPGGGMGGFDGGFEDPAPIDDGRGPMRPQPAPPIAPAPPRAAAAPAATVAPNVQPSNVLGEQDDPRWNAIMANLEAQFGGQRARLNEDLARRGLWASSGELGAGARLGDLEGQQSRALASARTDYQFQQDDRYDRLMQMLLPLILGG